MAQTTVSPKGQRDAGHDAGDSPAWHGVAAVLGTLFPPADSVPPNGRGRSRLGMVALEIAAVCAGAGALLLRVPGLPAWDSIYVEDKGVFLVGALAHPWHLLVPYAGYLQLGPRIIGQLVASFVPLVDAAAADTTAGALIAAACALFIYHASEGYIRSRWHRALAAAALLLLPVALMQIADCTVNTPWYATTALFFGVLWRPRTRAGMVAAALLACYATASGIVAFIYAPLLVIRLISLPRWREHAVTAGWLAGLLLQVPVVLETYAQHTQRLGRLAPPGQAVAFYLHNVVLRVPGWRISVHLVHLAGYNGATAVVGVLLAAMVGWALATGTRAVRMFTAAALVTGFVQTVFVAMVSSWVVGQQATASFLPAARYATVPIVLIDAVAIVAVDSCARRATAQGRVRGSGVRRPIATVTLACVLAAGWVTDFRYIEGRGGTRPWQPVARAWLESCARSQTGEITIPAWGKNVTATVECSRLRR